MPAVTDRAFKVEANGYSTIRPESGFGIYLWTDDPAGVCPIVLDEAA